MKLKAFYKTTLLIIIALFFINQQGNAQYNRVEFQTELIGNLHYPKYRGLGIINDIGFNYQQYIGMQTYAIIGVQGNFRKYKDDCKNCFDSYVLARDAVDYDGTIVNNQWTAFAGVRYMFRPEILYTYNYFFQCTFHYTRMNAVGKYAQGISEPELYSYNRFKAVGLGINFGSTYHFYSPWYVAVSVGANVSAGKRGNENYSPPPLDASYRVEKLLDNETLSKFGLELRIGYRFLTDGAR